MDQPQTDNSQMNNLASSQVDFINGFLNTGTSDPEVQKVVEEKEKKVEETVQKEEEKGEDGLIHRAVPQVGFIDKPVEKDEKPAGENNNAVPVNNNSAQQPNQTPPNSQQVATPIAGVNLRPANLPPMPGLEPKKQTNTLPPIQSAQNNGLPPLTLKAQGVAPTVTSEPVVNTQQKPALPNINHQINPSLNQISKPNPAPAQNNPLGQPNQNSVNIQKANFAASPVVKPVAPNPTVLPPQNSTPDPAKQQINVGEQAVNIEQKLEDNQAGVQQYWQTMKLNKPSHPLMQMGSSSRYRVPRPKNQKTPEPKVVHNLSVGGNFREDDFDDDSNENDHEELLREQQKMYQREIKKAKKQAARSKNNSYYGADEEEHLDADPHQLLHEVEYVDNDYYDNTQAIPTKSPGAQVLLEEVTPPPVQTNSINEPQKIRNNLDAFELLHKQDIPDPNSVHNQAQEIIERRKVNLIKQDPASSVNSAVPSTVVMQTPEPKIENSQELNTLVQENFANLSQSHNQTNQIPGQSDPAQLHVPQDQHQEVNISSQAVPHNLHQDRPQQLPPRVGSADTASQSEIRENYEVDIELPEDGDKKKYYDKDLSSTEILHQLLEVQQDSEEDPIPANIAREIEEPKKVKISKHIMNEVKHDKMSAEEEKEVQYIVTKKRTGRYLMVIGVIIAISLIGFGLVIVGLNFF